MPKQKKKHHKDRKSGNRETWEEPFSDDTFAFIAGYTSGGAAYGLTWEEMGIDQELPYEEKMRLWLEG